MIIPNTSELRWSYTIIVILDDDLKPMRTCFYFNAIIGWDMSGVHPRELERWEPVDPNHWSASSDEYDKDEFGWVSSRFYVTADREAASLEQSGELMTINDAIEGADESIRRRIKLMEIDKSKKL